jgi:para-aminobenzoate synthetase / 4-amino-4-deoxychorismate lyase
VIVQKGKDCLTPPVSCGLLPGIYRSDLIRKGLLKERVLFPEDLLNAQKIFLCNSVRGLVEVQLK